MPGIFFSELLNITFNCALILTLSLMYPMYPFLSSENFAPWLAPYAYGIVMLGLVFFLYRAFENWYASKYNKPLFRHYFVYKKLSSSQLEILHNQFPFYQRLSEKHKKQFQHRVVQFIARKKFIGRENLDITEEMKILIAALACLLSFGRRNYRYNLIDFILVYSDEFYSAINDKYCKGEFNPREKTLVFSWKHFRESLQLDTNYNIGIHEFMLALQLEATRSRDLDSIRFNKLFQNILKLLTDKELKNRLEKSDYFKEGFNNQFEFMGILAEYFFESPEALQSNFPKVYDYMKRLFNFSLMP